MESSQVLWLLIIMSIMQMILSQSDVDTTNMAAVITSTKDIPTVTSTRDIGTVTSPKDIATVTGTKDIGTVTSTRDIATETTSGEIKTSPNFELTTEVPEMNKNFSYISAEAKISNEIDLEKGRTVKRSTYTADSTESTITIVSSTESMLQTDAKNFLSSTTEVDTDETSVSEGTHLFDLISQSQGNTDRTLPPSRYSGLLKGTEETGETMPDARETSSDSAFGETTLFSEPSKTTKTSSAEISESKLIEDDNFSIENVGTDSVKTSPLHTDLFGVDSTDSDSSNTKDSRTTSGGFSDSTTWFLTSRSMKTVYPDLETTKRDDLTKQTFREESRQTQTTGGTSLSSLDTTEMPDLENKFKDDDNAAINDFEPELSESRDSFSAAEAEIKYASDGTTVEDGIKDSSTRGETTKNRFITNEPIIYTSEEVRYSNEGAGLKIKDNVAETDTTLDEMKSKTEAVNAFTFGNTEVQAEDITEQSVTDEQRKTKIATTTSTTGNDNGEYSKPTEIHEGFDEGSEDTVTELQEERENITLSSSEISKSTDIASDVESNSTRIPKRIQEPRYTETRYIPRPARPDPGYPYIDDADNSRPYRPDDLLYSRGQKPAADSYTPFRREPDYSRPARPDSYVPVDDVSRHAPDYSRQSSSDSGVPKPYRPPTSFARPYVPQGAFGRPYRPDREQSKPVSLPDVYSKTTMNVPSSSKPDNVLFGVSQPEIDFSESSHAGGDYDGKTSESNDFEYQRPNSDVKPIVLTPDVFRPYRPPLDTRQPLTPSPDREGDLLRPLRPVYLPSPSTVPDNDMSKSAVPDFGSKPVSKPDTSDENSRDMSRPSGSYPRPGFGSNYGGQPTGTSPKPFSPGTITLARNNLTRVEYIKADCFDNHMKVAIRFNGSFSGLVYSSGYSQDPTCSYINGSGRYHYEFFIRLNRCGTLGQQEVADQRVDTLTRRRQDRAQYLVNTVTVQYNPVIEEEIDEHFRVTCEYGYDFWKTVTFPVVSVETYLSRSSAMKVRTGSPVVFTLPPPQCNMEIRTGYGPSGNRVSGPVNVGDPLTLVIHMKSESAGFDILVSNCFAHNGAQKRLQLIDANGCVVQEKLVSPFRGVSSPDRLQQVTLYSYLKAFRFTGSPALYIECDVHMCHGSCPPQRCYWRHLYKRSIENTTATSTEDPVISESVSLFQSLEVRNEESDRPSSLAVSSSDGRLDEDVVCFRAAGFAAVLASLLILLVITCLTSICLCSRIRKMKTYFEAPDKKQFIQFDINTQRK